MSYINRKCHDDEVTRYLLFLMSALFAASQAAAQDYQSAVGLKFGGYENGLSLKYMLPDAHALEGEIGLRAHGLVVTGLYERYLEAFNTPGLKFYVGYGAHLGGVGKGEYHDFTGSNQDYTSGHVLLGIDALGGLEYVIPNYPIAVSLDINPRVELLAGPFFDVAPGVGLKYTF